MRNVPLYLLLCIYLHSFQNINGTLTTFITLLSATIVCAIKSGEIMYIDQYVNVPNNRMCRWCLARSKRSERSILTHHSSQSFQRSTRTSTCLRTSTSLVHMISITREYALYPGIYYAPFCFPRAGINNITKG